MQPQDDQIGTSSLPEGTQDFVFLIYESGSGEIVHGHRTVVLPSKESPRVDDLKREALQQAKQALHRDVAGLSVLQVSPGELVAGAHYRVDTRSGRLERMLTLVVLVSTLLSGCGGSSVTPTTPVLTALRIAGRSVPIAPMPIPSPLKVKLNGTDLERVVSSPARERTLADQHREAAAAARGKRLRPPAQSAS